MSLLTGKAEEAFARWLDDYSQNHHKKEWLDNDFYLDEVYLPDEILNALIIEWLDSVGIYTEFEICHYCIAYTLKDFKSTILYSCYIGFETRQQATEQAIIKANELYNKGD